jgi:hypothetical protein
VTLKGAGPGQDTEAQIDAIFQALRVAVRPTDWAAPGIPNASGGGHFYASGASGALTGAAANSPLLSLRWADSAFVFLLMRASLVYFLTTAYTGAQMNDFDLLRVTGFTAADSGGAAVVPMKKRNTMGASKVDDLRVCTTAALTAGTRTVDATSYRAVADGPPNVAIPTATLGVPRQELVLYDAVQQGVHPIALTKNEGLLIRNITAMSAAGVIKAYFNLEWAEVAVF